ncbi:unnamed protein product [Peronospora belbahrii]|uniref:Uncharacterized protein n=1 Tax=Peronospora belbahrii TaxID=622444 RepID=A0AAU9LGP2_9STRA|nr:unnamed protein product [Peronospora belbahrii]
MKTQDIDLAHANITIEVFYLQPYNQHVSIIKHDMICSRLLSIVAKNAPTPSIVFPSIALRQPNVLSCGNWFAGNETNSLSMELLNRNARRPKKANHGKRPCSHYRRRQKRLGAKKA